MIRRVVNPVSTAETEFRNAFLHTLQSDYQSDTPPRTPLFSAAEAVEVEIEFYRKLPLSMFLAETRERGLRNPQMLGTKPWDTHRPDVDNLAKFVMDALQGVLYEDDSQLAKLTLAKHHHMTPPFTGKTIVKFKSAVGHMF